MDRKEILLLALGGLAVLAGLKVSEVAAGNYLQAGMGGGMLLGGILLLTILVREKKELRHSVLRNTGREE